MKQEVKQMWLAALRSGEFKQGRHRLKTDAGKYCCLGVLCALYERENPGKGHFASLSGEFDRYYFVRTGGLTEEVKLPGEVVRWSGVLDCNPDVSIEGDGVTTLTGVNDRLQLTFEQIADIIEEQL